MNMQKLRDDINAEIAKEALSYNNRSKLLDRVMVIIETALEAED